MPVIELAADLTVDRPAAEVWPLVADYGHDPRWRAGVASMDPQPPGVCAVGTRTAEVISVAGRTYRNGGEVLSVTPGHTLAWKTTSGVDAEGTRTVTALDGDRCVVALRTRIRPRGVERLMAPVLAGMLQRTMTRDLRRLRALAESNAGRIHLRGPANLDE